MHRAKERDLQIWGQGGSRARYDYVSESFLMKEMLTDDFFGECGNLLQKGDHVTLTDAEDQIITVRVDEVNKGIYKVYLSMIERTYAIPVVKVNLELPDDPGLVYRYRSPRGGGHSVLTARGEVFAVNFDSRSEAERCIANCYESKVFEAPANHEPTEKFVSANAKAYKRA